MSSAHNIQIDYKIRINRVYQYIDDHLDGPISLATIADIACFSPFHFHRIFKSITGETLGEYINRRRMEKAASGLLHSDMPVSEIFIRCGFSDNPSFTRTFKKFYGVGPSGFRKLNPNRFSKISQLVSKIGQPYPDPEQYLCFINCLKDWIKMKAKIEVKEVQKLSLASVSSIGHQNLRAAYQILIRWATPLGFLTENTKMVTVYHDSFKITEASKVRMDACIVLNGPAKASAEVTLSSIEAGRYIIGSFEIGLDDFEKSWTGLYVWMNENGYKKADRNPFELYHNDFNDHPEKKALVDFYIPVVR